MIWDHPRVCGEKLCAFTFTISAMRDHPRVCGEKLTFPLQSAHRLGSPPRVRGKVNTQFAELKEQGITPACAGKSWTGSRASRIVWDHPRVCGEKQYPGFSGKSLMGSPPRVRGKGPFRQGRGWLQGITPACAGKSRRRKSGSAQKRDHPRVCGEKPLVADAIKGYAGSPPRVRGKELNDVFKIIHHGITPACAGKACSRAVPLPAAGITPACAGKSRW